MAAPKLVDTLPEVRQNAVAFAAMVSTIALTSHDADVIGRGFANAVEWIAFPDGKGDWLVSFCKFVTYVDGSGRPLTAAEYDKYRQTHMSGSVAKRRVEKFGGTTYPVSLATGKQHAHPAIAAVHDLCARFGKTPKITAQVRVFSDDGRPSIVDILLAAIRAAKLDHAERANLIKQI